MSRRRRAHRPPAFPCSAAEMIEFLKSRGFRMVRDGTHCVLRDGNSRTVSVPNHAQIAKGTHYQILRSALDPS